MSGDVIREALGVSKKRPMRGGVLNVQKGRLKKDENSSIWSGNEFLQSKRWQMVQWQYALKTGAEFTEKETEPQ